LVRLEITYGDAVSQREDAETLAVEGCLAGFEFGFFGGGSGCSEHGCGCCAEREEGLGEMHFLLMSIDRSKWMLLLILL
jgi:hypothetical protein